jgi:Zn ribbon nucleic-acid-binding protein
MGNFIVLEDCPCCRGNGMLVHEGGWSVQVECADCGSHTVFVEYANETEKKEAEQKVAMLWNIGKVIKSNIGE